MTLKRNKKIGLITGCFDILHLGHIRLFQFAKKHVDYLLVWIEQDETIRLTKGNKRPIHQIKTRIEVLQEIKSIDEVFQIEAIIDYKKDQKKSKAIFVQMLKKISPDVLITAVDADPFWQSKKDIAEELGVLFIPFEHKKLVSSSQLIEKMGL